jgi:hypothetical protein
MVATQLYCSKLCKAIRAKAIRKPDTNATIETLRSRAQNRQPKMPDYTPKPGDFTHDQWKREQAALSAHNGRKCQFRGCGKPLVGNQRMWCDKHGEAMNQVAQYVMWEDDWGYDGASRHG